MDKQYVCATIDGAVWHLSLDQICILEKLETACNKILVKFEYNGKEWKSFLFTKADGKISCVKNINL
jgi:hypothetical protein